MKLTIEVLLLEEHLISIALCVIFMILDSLFSPLCVFRQLHCLPQRIKSWFFWKAKFNIFWNFLKEAAQKDSAAQWRKKFQKYCFNFFNLWGKSYNYSYIHCFFAPFFHFYFTMKRNVITYTTKSNIKSNHSICGVDIIVFPIIW